LPAVDDALGRAVEQLAELVVGEAEAFAELADGLRGEELVALAHLRDGLLLGGLALLDRALLVAALGAAEQAAIDRRGHAAEAEGDRLGGRLIAAAAAAVEVTFEGGVHGRRGGSPGGYRGE